MRSKSMVAKENMGDNITQLRFAELSSMIPGLSKENEDSMLEDVINYMKQLQERANILEQQKNNKNMHVEKAWLCGDDIGATISSSFYQSKLPEIDVKAQGNYVLIRVHCENQKGTLTKMVGELEKLHLSIDNVSFLPFGDYFLDITVTAQMDDNYFLTMKNLKRDLREALEQFNFRLAN